VTDYAVGDHVSHPIFGDGIIRAIDENNLTIEFPESVTKQIIDSYVKHRRARSIKRVVPFRLQS